jgi:hypothetical protein
LIAAAMALFAHPYSITGPVVGIVIEIVADPFFTLFNIGIDFM